MPSKSWELQDVKLGPGGSPDDDTVVVGGVSVSGMTAERASELVERRMRDHVALNSSIQGVRIVDENGEVKARWTVHDVAREHSRRAGF